MKFKEIKSVNSVKPKVCSGIRNSSDIALDRHPSPKATTEAIRHYEDILYEASSPKERFDACIKAAEDGYRQAQYDLAVYYMEGKMITGDSKKAAFWFYQAAKQGHAVAQYELGRCFEDAIGFAKNPKEAFKWYLRSAKQNYDKAKYIVALCYRDGFGVEEDQDKYYKWIEDFAVHTGYGKGRYSYYPGEKSSVKNKELLVIICYGFTFCVFWKILDYFSVSIIYFALFILFHIVAFAIFFYRKYGIPKQLKNFVKFVFCVLFPSLIGFAVLISVLPNAFANIFAMLFPFFLVGLAVYHATRW